jgi:drug/metabolite transporter (DMT)-like permease
MSHNFLNDGTNACVAANYKTYVLTAAVVVGNVLGNTLLSHGMRQVGRVVIVSPLQHEIIVSLPAYLRAFVNPWVLSGVAVLALWMISDLALLSRADLSYVLPVTSISYVLIAILGRFALNEHISWTRWIGIIVISVGVILVGETSPRTTPEPPLEERK